MKNDIGRRISELRKSFGLNQEELAEKLNVTFQAVSKWETGASYPDIELLSLISECFHVSIDYLLKGNDFKSKIYYDQNYKEFTAENGINILSAFVKKPFIGPAPDTEKYTYGWLSGELFMFYHDWRIDLCEEVIFDCMSAGISHKHAVNRIIARKIQ